MYRRTLGRYSQSLRFIVLLRTFEASMGFVNYTNAMDIGNLIRCDNVAQQDWPG